MGCGCKCNCCAICSGGLCLGACCVCPPPTCGCGEDVLSGETCLNQTYYFYGTQNNTNVYYEFSFGYVIFIPVSGGGSVSSSIFSFFDSYFCWWGIGTIQVPGFGTSLPSGYTLATSGSGSAQNCFMWQSDITTGNPVPFTTYALAGCNSNWSEPEYTCS